MGIREFTNTSPIIRAALRPVWQRVLIDAGYDVPADAHYANWADVIQPLVMAHAIPVD